MCWHGKVNDKKIASRPIKVFKILYCDKKNKNIYHAPFYNQKYELGEMYQIAFISPRIVDDKTVLIDQGLHCYLKKKCYVEKSVGRIMAFNNKNEQLEWFETNKYYDGYFCPVTMVECTIPKGAEYWENKDGEIVTNSLIINRVCVGEVK